MGLFRDDGSNLHQPIPGSVLLAIGAVVLTLATFGWKSIAETREKNRVTQELKEGWLTIADVLQYAENNNGKWPQQWKDLTVDRSKKVSVNFTLTLDQLAKNPYLIYSAIELHQHPELQDRLKPDLDDFREQLLELHAKRSQ